MQFRKASDSKPYDLNPNVLLLIYANLPFLENFEMFVSSNAEWPLTLQHAGPY